MISNDIETEFLKSAGEGQEAILEDQSNEFAERNRKVQATLAKHRVTSTARSERTQGERHVSDDLWKELTTHMSLGG